MHFAPKAFAVAFLFATSSASSFASAPGSVVDFSGLYSRGNVESTNNNSVVYTVGAGVDANLTQIDFAASVLANPDLFFGTPIGDLSVLVRYQDGVADLSANLGFDVLNGNTISSIKADSITGALQDSDGNAHQFGWHIKTGGTFTFSFNELFDDAHFDGLTGPAYWDAQWQNGSSLSLVTAAVPEPETYALMLAGLGLVGFAARRRKSM
jgi:hypothetical protein